MAETKTAEQRNAEFVQFIADNPTCPIYCSPDVHVEFVAYCGRVPAMESFVERLRECKYLKPGTMMATDPSVLSNITTLPMTTGLSEGE